MAHRRPVQPIIGQWRGGKRRGPRHCFYYLNRTGFQTASCRFNQSGEFQRALRRLQKPSITFGILAHTNGCSKIGISSALTFNLVPLEAGDFVYDADSAPTMLRFTPIRQGSGSAGDEQVRAAEWLARHKGPCILSNQATERIVTACIKSLDSHCVFP